jgi:hypothetical protein
MIENRILGICMNISLDIPLQSIDAGYRVFHALHAEDGAKELSCVPRYCRYTKERTEGGYRIENAYKTLFGRVTQRLHVTGDTVIEFTGSGPCGIRFSGRWRRMPRTMHLDQHIECPRFCAGRVRKRIDAVTAAIARCCVT